MDEKEEISKFQNFDIINPGDNSSQKSEKTRKKMNPKRKKDVTSQQHTLFY